MNICVVDDVIDIAKAVKEMINYATKDLKEDVKSFAFYNSNDFYNWLDENNTVDICFLDIRLGEDSDANGLQIAKRLKKLNYRTIIIFISDYDDYYMDLVQVEPFRFLHKPFTYKDFIPIFKSAFKRYYLQNQEDVCEYKFTFKGIVFKTDLNKIKYIYSEKRKICMKSITHEEFEFYGKLDSIENEISLLSKNFLRISKSYLVNTNYVKSFNKNFVQVGDEELSMGTKYKNVVIETLSIN